MRGDYLKIKAYINEYGSDFCVDAIQRAIAINDARNIIHKVKHLKTINKKQGEARIIAKASELGVRINM